MGCGPRARSVLHCHGVLALRRGPVTGAVQDASQLQEDASWQLAVQKGRQSQGLELVSSHFSLHISPSLPWCFSPAKGSCDRSCAGRKPAARGRKLAVGSAEGQAKSRSGGSSESNVWHSIAEQAHFSTLGATNHCPDTVLRDFSTFSPPAFF